MEGVRVEVILEHTFPEPIEHPRYNGQPMFITRCLVTWRSEADYHGNHFSVTVYGARRKKNGELYSEALDEDIWGSDAPVWLERAGITSATVASALIRTTDLVGTENGGQS